MKALTQMKNLLLAAGIIMLLLLITCISVYADDEDIKQSNVSAKDRAGASVVISGSCGYNLTWTLDDEGILVISGKGSMTSASASTDSPFYGILSSIKSIVIEDGVTTVGSCAFYGCTTLESLTMADSITSIGEHAFRGCSKLTDFILSDNLKTIGDKSFYDCENLKSVALALGNYDLRETGILDYAETVKITSGSELSYVIYPEFGISVGVFQNCTRLVSI